MADETKNIQKLIASTNKTVFSTDDFNKVWQYDNYRSLIRRINYLQKTNKIIKIKRGLYSINGRSINELELANKIRTPSYISFETVLHKEGLVFQWDERITLAGKESAKFIVNNNQIEFRQIKDEILLNMQGIYEENNYFIASKERALLDMLYIDSSFHFDNLRSVDFEMISKILPIYNRKSIAKNIERLNKDARSY